MENKIWQDNMEALEEMLPGWKDYIEKEEYKENEEFQNRTIVQVKKEASYAGETISCVTAEEKKYYLAGKYNPQQMAAYRVKEIEQADFGTVVFVMGFSDGRVLRELVEKVSSDTIILVYEPSIDIFLHTMREYRVADIFERHVMGLVIEGINGEELKPLMEQAITVENMSKLRPVIQGNYEKLFARQIKQAVAVLNKRVLDLNFHWNTCVEFTNETIVNCIKNYKYLYRHYTINELVNTLEEKQTVIVVAAGPSLDKNIDLLREAKGKACIIACDTALKPLLKRDIVPDFFVVVDPRKPMELFEESRICKIPMISGLNIPYQLMQKHTGKKILYFDTLFTLDLLDYVFEGKERTDRQWMQSVPTGGSVATSAFSIGRMMGAKTIILVGQDLALSEEKEHAEGTFKSDRKFDLKNPSLPKVEGVNGEQLPTLHNLKLYLEWFEEQIAEQKELLVVDATEGGARIHGSRELTLREALDTYCTQTFDGETYWEKRKLHFDAEEQERALAFYRQLPERLEKIRKLTVKGKNLYKKLEKCASHKNYSMGEVKNLLKRIKKVNNELEESTLAQLMMEGLKGVEYTLRASIYQFQEEEQKNLVESARIGSYFLGSMEIAIKEMKPEILKLSEFLGEY